MSVAATGYLPAGRRMICRASTRSLATGTHECQLTSDDSLRGPAMKLRYRQIFASLHRHMHEVVFAVLLTIVGLGALAATTLGSR